MPASPFFEARVILGNLSLTRDDLSIGALRVAANSHLAG